jgi:hypothetical protein
MVNYSVKEEKDIIISPNLQCRTIQKEQNELKQNLQPQQLRYQHNRWF